MAYFLFATLDAGGNVPPALGIAHELVRDGHRARFLGNPQQAGRIEATGAEFQAYDRSFRMAPAEHMSTRQQISMMVSAFADPGVARDIVEEARHDPPDVVIIDCLLLSGIDAATRAGLRTVVLVHSFYAFFDGPFRRTPLTAVIAARGLGPRRVMKRAERILVCSDPLLDPAGGKNGNGKLVWTGPVAETQPAIPALSDPSPQVLVSLSTTAFPGQEKFLDKALQAVADLPIKVVVTTGPAIDPAGFTAPPNTTVHRYLPHRDVMPDCAAVIGHGGHATTMLALGHGLPLVIAPMHPLLDQRMVGKAVQDAGAGLLIKASSSPEEIAGAVKNVLYSADFRSAAIRVAQRVRVANGARTGARVLVEMIT